MPPKVVVSIPESLQTTAGEREQLKRAFKTKIKSVVKPHDGGSAPVTNVGRVVTEVVVVSGAAARKRRGAKRKAAKKAGKKK